MTARARQLQVTPLAESDLEDIWRYTFAHWSLEQADRYHRDLVATMEALTRGENTGSACQVRDGYFQYAVGAHLIFWREADATLDVIRIFA